MTKKIRKFETGATRDADEGKLDYEGFFSPLVMERRAQYMHKHRFQSDGSLRDSDNWQKGIPIKQYVKSLFRHFVDVWKEVREIRTKEGLEEALCALCFNAEGILFEVLSKPATIGSAYPKTATEISDDSPEDAAAIVDKKSFKSMQKRVDALRKIRTVQTLSEFVKKNPEEQ